MKKFLIASVTLFSISLMFGCQGCNKSTSDSSVTDVTESDLSVDSTETTGLAGDVTLAADTTATLASDTTK